MPNHRRSTELGEEGGWLAVARTLTTILIGLSAAAVAVLTAGPQLVSANHFLTTLAGSLIILAALIGVRFLLAENAVGALVRRRQRKKRPAGELQRGFHLTFPRTGAQNQKDFIDLAQKTFAERFPSPEMLSQTIGALIDPSGTTARITERFEIRRACLRISTTRVVLHPPGETFIACVLREEKGTLADELRLSSGSISLTTLSHTENQGAVLASMKVLFATVFGEGAEPQLLQDVLATAAAERPVDPQGVLQKLDEARRRRQLAENEKYFSLYELVRFTARHYFLLAAVPASDVGRTKLTLERTHVDRNMLARRRDVARILTGLEVRDFSLPLKPAAEAASYHALVPAPEGMYVFSSLLEPRRVTLEGPRSNAPRRPFSDTPLATITDSDGLDYVHVYARDIDGDLAEFGSRDRLRLDLRIKFRERPPGLLLAVALLAAFLAGLVISVGRYHDAIFPRETAPAGAAARPSASAMPSSSPMSSPGAATPTSSTSVSSSSTTSYSYGSPTQSSAARPDDLRAPVVSPIITALFGITALLAGWIVTRFSGDSLRKVSFATAFLALWFVVDAAGSAFLAAFKNLRTGDDRVDLPGIELAHLGWSLTIASCAANAAIAIVVLSNRSLRYRRRVRSGRKWAT